MAATKYRPKKHEEPLALARDLLAKGSYRYTPHASARMKQRGIIHADVCRAIGAGRHEKSKDTFDERWGAWSYAIRGKTIDQRDLRIPISFEETDSLLVVVTTIDLDAEEEP